jgi:hypothetical protein
MMTTHELKTDPGVFQASWEGLKKFEIRFNDRDFRPGDILILKETKYSYDEMNVNFDSKPLGYTGREIEQEVDYVLHGGAYGLDEGWAVLSVTTVNTYERDE